ncbi:hypothetical protein PENDEC_c022G03060 [Penicillium decumbens]|uniref:Uncharacterized protein n=1 Tax=Penicillium decumbens TaxID=69771 RepID=A0A1V6P0X9_PENDC|nr:hypothetical protein PENDEC_c022G03060 [Penicillium decumbens]
MQSAALLEKEVSDLRASNEKQKQKRALPGSPALKKVLVDKETLEFSERLLVLRDAIKEQDNALASALDAVLKPVAEKVDNTVHGGNVGVMSAHRSNINQTFGK